MIQTKHGDITEITICSPDTLTIIAEPIALGDIPAKVGLCTHRVLGLHGFMLSPGEMWITVYREAKNNYLFLVSGDRNEEEIRVRTAGPDEEKSELVLERVCVLSAFG